MEDTMVILHTTTKGRMLNTLEKFDIYGETKNNNQINDRHTVTPNAIFDAVLLNSNDRALKVQQLVTFTHSSVTHTAGTREVAEHRTSIRTRKIEIHRKPNTLYVQFTLTQSDNIS
jgi:hypothetical protein